MIGASPEASGKLLDFLRGDGYIAERSEDRSAYGVYIDGTVRCEEAEEKRLIERIETAEVPLVKLGRGRVGRRVH